MRIMIIGAGDIGMPIIHYLSQKGDILTVVEMDEKRCKEIAVHSDAAIFQGSGTDLEIWKSAEADKMDALLILTNEDEVNAEICKIAKREFGIPFVIARAKQPANIAKMKELGADVVICPPQEARRLFLNALEGLSANILYDAPNGLKVVMVTIPPNGSIVGKNVEQIDIPENCKIGCVCRNDTLEFPTLSFTFKGGDKVMLLGSRDSVEKIAEKLRTVEFT